MDEDWRADESEAQYLVRFRASPIGKAVEGRAEVARLAAQDPKRALQVARSIEHPWYRCQAITSVVEANLSYHRAEALLDEALAAAHSQDEPNQIASVGRWPLRQLVAIASPKAADQAKRLLQVIANEPHGLRKLDGLCGVLLAVASSADLRALVLEPFLQAAVASQGWRTERLIDTAAAALIPFDRAAATRILGQRPPSRYTKRSRAALSAMPASINDDTPDAVS